jgi:5'(3')-deoxyribonucleotidase
MPGAIDAFEKLFEMFDVYILSTPPWRNPDAWIHKKNWIEKYIPKAKRRLILSHHKNLAKGDYLIDDTFYRGQKDFEGEWLHFGSKKYPGWDSVMEYMNKQV